MNRTFVRIVPAFEDDLPDLFRIRKGNTFLNTDRGNSWGSRTQANMFKSQVAATTYAKQQGWWILPEVASGATVHTVRAPKGRIYIADSRVTAVRHLLSLLPSGVIEWTENEIEASTFTGQEADAIVACSKQT